MSEARSADDDMAFYCMYKLYEFVADYKENYIFLQEIVSLE